MILIFRAYSTVRATPLQFRLRTLLVVLMAISLVFGLVGRRVHDYRCQAAVIRQLELSGMTIVKQPGTPRWLSLCCEEGVFVDARVVGVRGPSLNSLRCLPALPRLRAIYIDDARVTADDLSVLTACKSLKCVGFCRISLGSKSIEALATATHLDMAIFEACQFEERSFENLSGLRHLKMLKILNMDIDKDAGERIVRSLPGVNVSIAGPPASSTIPRKQTSSNEHPVRQPRARGAADGDV